MDFFVDRDGLIHTVFEEQAAHNPDALAIKFGDQEISYNELNARANYFAEHLLERGCLHGDIVAVAMGRTPEMIIAILAILKIGAAYYPLDSTSPVQRNLYCLNQANVETIITDHNCDDLIESKRNIISTDSPLLFNSYQQNNLSPHGKTDDKCYVMYTSGSTGAPKGVVVPHRAVIRLVKNTNYISIASSDNIFQFAPLSFDASTFEIWGALLNGATLVLYSGLGLDPNLFAREIRDNNITILWLTAALFHMLVSRYLDSISTVKTLLAGGDVLFPNSINAVFDKYPDITVINGYGPTENTTFTCCHRMTNANRPGTSVPIGKAVMGTTLHILDKNYYPVPKGTEGELFVSGKGVALGYLGHANQNSFFYNHNIAPGLIYATGDRVYENESGELEFRGRVDNQVKLRGYRVSLEEVQSSLLKLDKVNEALVFLRKYDSGDQQLVAVLKMKNDDAPNVSDIKKLLSASLPKYMIPDIFHFNSEFPICKNGKIDRHALIKDYNVENIS